MFFAVMFCNGRAVLRTLPGYVKADLGQGKRKLYI